MLSSFTEERNQGRSCFEENEALELSFIAEEIHGTFLGWGRMKPWGSPLLQKKEVWVIPPLRENEAMGLSSFTEEGSLGIPPLRNIKCWCFLPFTESGSMGHPSFEEQ